MTKYELNTWYGWNGGECPVHPETEVVIKWSFNGVETTPYTASHFVDYWEGNSICAFKIVREYRKPREWWITKGNGYSHAHDTIEAAQAYRRCNAALGVEIIHVREVIDGEDEA